MTSSAADHRLRSSLALVAVLAVAVGCAAPRPLAVENSWSTGVVVRVTGIDGRVGTWWAAPGSAGVARAEQWPDLEPLRVELLLDDGTCTEVYEQSEPTGAFRVEADGSVLPGTSEDLSVALPVTSRCAR